MGKLFGGNRMVCPRCHKVFYLSQAYERHLWIENEIAKSKETPQ